MTEGKVHIASFMTYITKSNTSRSSKQLCYVHSYSYRPSQAIEKNPFNRGGNPEMGYQRLII